MLWLCESCNTQGRAGYEAEKKPHGSGNKKPQALAPAVGAWCLNEAQRVDEYQNNRNRRQIAQHIQP